MGFKQIQCIKFQAWKQLLLFVGIEEDVLVVLSLKIQVYDFFFLFFFL